MVDPDVLRFHPENLHEVPPRFKELIEKGDRDGFVSAKEVLNVIPNPESRLKDADYLFLLLQERGIELITEEPRDCLIGLWKMKNGVKRKLFLPFVLMTFLTILTTQ